MVSVDTVWVVRESVTQGTGMGEGGGAFGSILDVFREPNQSNLLNYSSLNLAALPVPSLLPPPEHVRLKLQPPER